MGHMGHAAPAALGVYKPRRPQASPVFRLVRGHLHRLQTVYDERVAHEYGPWWSPACRSALIRIPFATHVDPCAAAIPRAGRPVPSSVPDPDPHARHVAG